MNCIKHLTLIVIIIASNLVANSQITIRKDQISDKEIFKPKDLDSLSNLEQKIHIYDYKEYIGHKIYYLPRNKNWEPYERQSDDSLITNLHSMHKVFFEGKTSLNKSFFFNKESVFKTIKSDSTDIYDPFFVGKRERYSTEYNLYATKRTKVENHYFTIIDILVSKYGDDNYVKLDELLDYKSSYVTLKFILRNESTQDTLYWLRKSFNIENSSFLLVPYFAKKQNDNKSKLFTAIKENNDYVDINSGSKIKIQKGEEWMCTDVSLIEYKDFKYLKPFYFFKKGNQEIMIPFDKSKEETFLLTKTYNRLEEEKRKNEEQRQKEKIELEKRIQQELELFNNSMISKYGKEVGTLIINKKVKLGMSKEMCRNSWGNPIEINETIVDGLVSEQWVYGLGTYLYFENNKLTAIQR